MLKCTHVHVHMDPHLILSRKILYLGEAEERKGEEYEGEDVTVPTCMTWWCNKLDTDTINIYQSVDTLKLVFAPDIEQTRIHYLSGLTLKLKSLELSSQGLASSVELKSILELKDTLKELTIYGVRPLNLDVISKLTSLEKLKITFSDPIESLEFLRGCNSLRSLELSYFNVRSDLLLDLTPLADIQALRSLTLSDAKIRGLNLLDRLSSIHIGTCEIDLKELTSLTALEKMVLYRISTESSSRYRSADEVETIDLSFLSGAFPLLKRLILSDISLENMSALSTSSTLKQLSLGYCTGVKDITPLSNLTLETLSLEHTDVKDISVLKDMTTLKVLKLTQTNVEDCSVIETLTGLETLYLCSQKELDLRIIRDLKQLKNLQLSECSIRTGVRELACIKHVILDYDYGYDDYSGYKILTSTLDGEEWVSLDEATVMKVKMTGEELVNAIVSTPNFYDPESGMCTKNARSSDPERIEEERSSFSAMLNGEPTSAKQEEFLKSVMTEYAKKVVELSSGTPLPPMEQCEDYKEMTALWKHVQENSHHLQ